MGGLGPLPAFLQSRDVTKVALLRFTCQTEEGADKDGRTGTFPIWQCVWCGILLLHQHTLWQDLGTKVVWEGQTFRMSLGQSPVCVLRGPSCCGSGSLPKEFFLLFFLLSFFLGSPTSSAATFPEIAKLDDIPHYRPFVPSFTGKRCREYDLRTLIVIYSDNMTLPLTNALHRPVTRSSSWGRHRIRMEAP